MICFLLASTEPIIFKCMHEMSAAESYLVSTKCSPFAWCHCHGIEIPLRVDVGADHRNLLQEL